MKYFKKTEMIRCFRENKSDRCAGCCLTKAVKSMPYGIEENIEVLVDNVLDPLREKYGKPIVVNSGFRCPKHNLAVGGVTNSQHVKGEAADIRPLNENDNVNLNKLVEIIKENGKFDQLIIYPTFVHVSYKKNGGNRKQVLRG